MMGKNKALQRPLEEFLLWGKRSVIEVLPPKSFTESVRALWRSGGFV